MTEVSPPDAILLRFADEPDPYVRALGEVGFRAVCRPVLSFDFPAEQALQERLQNRDHYGGIVATSPRAARAVRRVFDASGTVHTEWEGAPSYVVGPKTAERFRELGFDVQGAETGTAEDLVSFIAERPPDAPLLFLSGSRRHDTLPDGLTEANIPYQEEVVYVTSLRTDLTLPPAAKKGWLVFFSPSGLEAVQASDAGPVDEYRVATIGPTTAEALREKGVEVEAVADAPSPDGLARALSQAPSTAQ